MMTENGPRRYGMAALASGLAGASIYLLMINVTLAHIETVSGQIPFDMRPFGYGPQEAAQLLDALGADGRRYYLTRQIPLDTVYPALLAMTLVSSMLWFGTRLPNSRLVRTGIVFAVGAAFFDYAENIGIAAMILGWPDVSDALVQATSAASVVKSCSTTAAAFIVLCLWVMRISRSKVGLRC